MSREKVYPLTKGGLSVTENLPGYTKPQVLTEPGAINTGDVPVQGSVPLGLFRLPRRPNRPAASTETVHSKLQSALAPTADTQQATSAEVPVGQRLTVVENALLANSYVMTNKPEQRGGSKQRQQAKIELVTGAGILVGEMAAVPLGIGLSISPLFISLGLIGVTGLGVYCLINGIRNMINTNKENKNLGLVSQTGELEKRQAAIEKENDNRVQRFLSAVHERDFRKLVIAVFPHLKDWITTIRPQK